MSILENSVEELRSGANYHVRKGIFLGALYQTCVVLAACSTATPNDSCSYAKGFVVPLFVFFQLETGPFLFFLYNLVKFSLEKVMGKYAGPISYFIEDQLVQQVVGFSWSFLFRAIWNNIYPHATCLRTGTCTGYFYGALAWPLNTFLIPDVFIPAYLQVHWLCYFLAYKLCWTFGKMLLRRVPRPTARPDVQPNQNQGAPIQLDVGQGNTNQLDGNIAMQNPTVGHDGGQGQVNQDAGNLAQANHIPVNEGPGDVNQDKSARDEQRAGKSVAASATSSSSAAGNSAPIRPVANDQNEEQQAPLASPSRYRAQSLKDGQESSPKQGPSSVLEMKNSPLRNSSRKIPSSKAGSGDGP